MDAFARLAPVAAELLGRVDSVLTEVGAPAGHPVWPLLRRLRALPGEAVGALAAAAPGPLAAAGDTLGTLADEYERLLARLPSAPDWRGTGADSFTAQWRALRAHIDGDLADRVRGTASFLDAVRSWQAETREAVARTLAAVLTSAEAIQVVVTADPARVASAAADIAAAVLQPLAIAYERGEQVLAEGDPRLGEATYRPPAPGGPVDRAATTEVTL